MYDMLGIARSVKDRCRQLGWAAERQSVALFCHIGLTEAFLTNNSEVYDLIIVKRNPKSVFLFQVKASPLINGKQIVQLCHSNGTPYKPADFDFFLAYAHQPRGCLTSPTPLLIPSSILNENKYTITVSYDGKGQHSHKKFDFYKGLESVGLIKLKTYDPKLVMPSAKSVRRINEMKKVA